MGVRWHSVTQSQSQILCLAVCRGVCEHASPCVYAPFPYMLYIVCTNIFFRTVRVLSRGNYNIAISFAFYLTIIFDIRALVTDWIHLLYTVDGFIAFSSGKLWSICVRTQFCHRSSNGITSSVDSDIPNTSRNVHNKHVWLQFKLQFLISLYKLCVVTLQRNTKLKIRDNYQHLL